MFNSFSNSIKVNFVFINNAILSPSQIPSLAEWVQGEESAEFTNTLGEQITVRICDTQDGTATLLAKVLHSKPDLVNEEK